LVNQCEYIVKAINNLCYHYVYWDSVVGSGTMLQTERSRVEFPMRSFDFFLQFT
jgi:hypothetical protein